MITIDEISPPKKLSGLSSFLVKFPYNAEIVEILKGFQPAIFDKKNLTWEISSVYLSQLLDQLTYFDDIELKLAANEINTISKKDLSDNEIKEFKYAPYRHQIEAVNYALKHKSLLLLDSMGLG